MRAGFRPKSLATAGCVAAAALALFLLASGGAGTRRAGFLFFLPPLAVGLLGSRSPKDEWEQQAAFEKAERDRAERRAAAVFESFVDACPVAVELFAVDGRLLRSNKAAERLLGKIPPPGISLFDPRGLRRAGLLEPQVRRVLAGTRVETPSTWYDPTEIGLPGVPGSKVCFRATVFPLFDSENAVTRIAVLHEDITDSQSRAAADRLPAPEPAAPADAAGAEDVRDVEFRRRKLEQSLRENEERFRSFVENARGYVVLRFSEDGRIVAVSPSIQDILGISAGTILTDPSTFYAQVVPEDLARVRELDAGIRATGAWPDDYRFRVRNKTTGAERWVELGGSVAAALGRRTFDAIAFDVTRRLELEQSLARRQSSLDSIVASVADGIATLDTELRVLTWSPGAEVATALPAAEAVGRSLAELYPDFEKVGFLPAVRRTLREQKVARHEAFYHDGREPRAGWFSVTSYPYETGVLLLIRNVSEQHRTGIALRQAESRLQGLLASPNLAISLKDKDLRYRLANPLALRMLGADDAAAIEGRTDADLLKKPVAALIAEHDRRALGGSKPVELEVCLPDAIGPESSWYRLTKIAFRDPDGDVSGVLTVGWDISRRVNALQELARRRAWLETLAAEHRGLLDKTGRELGRWQD
ncbi:MAG: PAS domain-containing protein [bacterium]